MSEPIEKKAPAKPILVVVLIGFLIFLSIQIVGKVTKFSDRREMTRKIEVEQAEKDSLEESTGLRQFVSGDLFIPDDKSFVLPILVELNMVKDMVAGDVLFIGVSKNVSQDKAGLLIKKIPFDSTLTMMENWTRNENNHGIKYLPEGVPSEVEGTCAFGIVSSDQSMRGFIRLERKDESIYIIKGVSVTNSWNEYKNSFTYSINSFRFVDSPSGKQ